jgi:Ca-activated chloride channel family protein
VGGAPVTFFRPELLPLAPLAALIFALALGSQWRRLVRLTRMYDPAIIDRLFPVRLDHFPTGRLLSLVVAGVALGLAAAGPAEIVPEPPEPPPPLDVAIVVDLSLSMSAADTEPSRIARAREVITRLTEELPSVRFSLVVFAGWPYTLLPPTDDPSVVRYFAQALEADLVGELDRGSSLSGALPLAQSALERRPRPSARRAILVLSDGEAHEVEASVLSAALQVAAAGTEVWVAGLGTQEGTLLSVGNEPVVDASGNAVLTRLNTDLLQAIASSGGGRYENVSNEAGLTAFVGGLRELSGVSDEGLRLPVDATYLLTLLAIPFLLWEGAADAGRGWLRARGGEGER